MSEQTTWRFKINAYSPSTMPLARLIEYLAPLTALLGTEDIHLLEVEEGSTAPVLTLPVASVEQASARLTAAAAGKGDEAAERAFARVNALLVADDADAFIERADGAQVIRFPGSVPETSLSTVQVTEDGHYDGVLQSVDGTRDIVPVRLRTFDGKPVSGFKTSRETAKLLGSHLFEPVRLFGTGTWSRGRRGGWQLDKFRVDTFKPLASSTIGQVVQAIRASGFKMEPDAAAAILQDRLDEAS